MIAQESVCLRYCGPIQNISNEVSPWPEPNLIEMTSLINRSSFSGSMASAPHQCSKLCRPQALNPVPSIWRLAIKKVCSVRPWRHIPKNRSHTYETYLIQHQVSEKVFVRCLRHSSSNQPKRIIAVASWSKLGLSWQLKEVSFMHSHPPSWMK